MRDGGQVPTAVKFNPLLEENPMNFFARRGPDDDDEDEDDEELEEDDLDDDEDEDDE